ncbi:carbohydrate-binding protein [Puniceicoccales bacterium CK1056]|uniref:Carbohydrate-binding protein n=1 Tax=Oceanipulchritudo coccoides TaxID=2706888 RepID=A0A6B2LYE8_9BACT|nr:NosD domain-containing protein [Oceanipulchritudo coccoides]NDV61109.1 carbohydrate-binding protein [Oceanipulchritudo coccoides]
MASTVVGSLQARVDAVPEGGTLVLDSGTYEGPLRIDKAMTIDGKSKAVIDGKRSGSVITVNAPGVRIRNLYVRNSGLSLEEDDAGILVRADRAVLEGNRIESCLHGIYLKKVTIAEVRGNTIVGAATELARTSDVLSTGLDFDGGDLLCAVGELDVNRRGNGIHAWNSRNVLLEENVISHTRDGIYFSFTDESEVLGNRVTDCRYGLHYMYSDGNTFARNRFSRNAAGAALMYSGRLLVEGNEFSGNRGKRAYGALLQSVDASVLKDNRFINNTVGLYSENAQDNELEDNVVGKNYIGYRIGGSSRGNRHFLNHFQQNIHNVELAGEGKYNEWAVEGRGNRWGLSSVPDLDGDGVGEFPHRESDLLGGLRQQFPIAGLLSGSPGLELIRFINERSPIPGLRTVEDPHPLTNEHD